MSRYADLLKEMKEMGHEIVVVVGGGKLARDFISIAKDLGLEEEAQDVIAISVSRIFALLLVKTLGDLGSQNVPLTVDNAAKYLGTGKIPVMGGLKPGMTTDTVAVIVAERINADLIIKGTDQDGVYNKDPRKHKDAFKLENLSLEDLTNVFSERKHKAGIHQIIDPETVKILKDKKMKLIILNGFKPENVLAAINGESVGTVIN